jgi:ELWxxDGT repeat protein
VYSTLDRTLDGFVYFTCRDANAAFHLCRTNGDGHTVFADVDGAWGGWLVADRLVFSISSALWVTDGTTDGTHELAVTTGVLPVSYRDVLYFTGCDNDHGCELWRTDATPAGTFMEADLAPGTASSFPDGFHAAADALYFHAETNEHGDEPWVMRH